MKKIILSVLLVAVFFISLGFTQERKREEIDSLLNIALAEAISYSPKYSIGAAQYADSKIAEWEKSADNSPLNQYRRGYLYYIQGYKTGETEYFVKALSYLKEVKKAGLKEFGLDEMIKMCEMNDAERKKQINEKNAANDKRIEDMSSRR